MTLLDKVNLVERAIKNSEYNILPNEIYNIHGLTSPRSQNFLNLVSLNKSVLEIGAFCGASTCAIANSAKSVITIDNWKDNEVISVDKKYKKIINKPKDIFELNIQGFDNIDLISEDAFSKNVFNKLYGFDIDIIFYDGPHSTIDITKFFMIYEHLFVDTILIIDDYNFDSVKEGISYGIEIINIKPYKEYIIETQVESRETFWNGIAIFIFE